MGQKAKDYFELQSVRNLRLKAIPVRQQLLYHSERHCDALLDDNRARLEELQSLLYASHTQALLIVFQGMDTSGKDGAIKHVMSGVNPQGCSVISFKTPSSEELDHDFLWRINRALPARGQIGIFNRSYYEETLITRVHPEILEKEKLPSRVKTGEKFWARRYQDIVNHEKYLHHQGYEIIKIFIHISREEQKRRLLARFDDPNKNWKISEGDVKERAFWKEYQRAYELCIENTVSKHSPWYIVPGDDKRSARLGISNILVHRLAAMGLRYPVLSADQKKRLKELKSDLLKG